MMADAAGLPRILVVDDSRIVRATIIKRIRDRFDVREETDGEAGWEALLIDPTLRLVVTDHSMPRLDGFGLIERIRASRVARIRDIPVIMISGDEEESARQRAKDLGATDFITKGIGTAELLARLDSLVDLGRTHEALEEARAEAVTDSASGLLTPTALRHQADQFCSYVNRHGGQGGVLAIGIDRYEELAAVDANAADEVESRLAEVLSDEVRKEDGFARWQAGRFMLATPGSEEQQTKLFAERLRGKVEAAGIGWADGGPMVTVTVGIASCPADGDQVEDVLACAERRLAEAMAAGGNRVAGGAAHDDTAQATSVDAVLGHIGAGRREAAREQLQPAGQRMLPLLRMLDEEYGLGLPIADIERRLAAGKDVGRSQ